MGIDALCPLVSAALQPAPLGLSRIAHVHFLVQPPSSKGRPHRGDMQYSRFALLAKRRLLSPDRRANYDGVQDPKSTNTSSRLTSVVDISPVFVSSATLQA